MIQYHSIIPAENPAKADKPLNLLLVAENLGDCDVTAPIRLFGNDGYGWRELLAEDRELPAHEHVHLYFQIPADRFGEAFWGAEAPEELEILASDTLPGPKEQGLLLFLI